VTSASGGERWSSASDGVAAELLRLLRSRTGEEEERGAGETEWRLGARDAIPTGISLSAVAHPRRRRTAAMWPAPGGARRASACGREGRGNRAAWLGWAEREAGRPSIACPLFFFFEIIFPKSLKETFEAFAKLFRGWSKKKNCSPQNSLQLCFNR